MTHALHQAIAALGPLAVLGPLPTSLDTLTDNSRAVQRGGGFVAVRGSGTDGHHYIDNAARAGAAVIFCEELPASLDPAVAYVHVDSTRAKLAALAALAYGRPSEELVLFGVTGTNGKTTTTYMLESIGRALGLSVGVLGTVSHRYPGFVETAENTTPGLLKTASLLRNMVDAGVRWVAAEVSSHGLTQGRLDGLSFDAGAWTNLQRDHLDYHHDMTQYGAAKALFFTEVLARSAQTKRPCAVLCADDPGLRDFVGPGRESAWGGRALWYGLGGDLPSPSLTADKLRSDARGWSGELVLSTGLRVAFTLPFFGRFNVLNALAAVGCAWSSGVELADLAQALSALAPVPGRMEAFGGHGAPRVFVDYSHTPDALANALETLREITKGTLWVVFGAGGDRDSTKRSEMGRIASTLADRAIVTNDNPRNEDPQRIADAILAGMPSRHDVQVELDRALAVSAAVCGADEDDVVLIAGKGHEDYQIIGKERRHLDDRELAVAALAQRSERT
ncbi:MAG: UDP-N-acetylmuramoyl-L-alanyl-D-glutamate--2,6-diaminopimelate ligase [Deltaproteobacteria bacterium CG2_30_63_29]|nr:MAG: UDP-N-acetylmuramoyl-L-alanyl-D-glutamate--2,6-diaminopimelate ligase [Deltaproteobacteria bacterium CG2_30_63_29]PJB34073.1 MAG: UDP-N-acetylmuramoyl-L-alanyl-D-glutamate--2,6-diaminopimelate ligase [Deltaproteobacteria bacterium CG_4_9_14_3_um_filter_63_12]